MLEFVYYLYWYISAWCQRQLPSIACSDYSDSFELVWVNLQIFICLPSSCASSGNLCRLIHFTYGIFFSVFPPNVAFNKWVIISFGLNYCFYTGNVLANHPGENNWTHLKKGSWVDLKDGHRSPARGIAHLGHFWAEEFSCLFFLIPMLGFHLVYFIDCITKVYMYYFGTNLSC